jgi:hypothetical protein
VRKFEACHHISSYVNGIPRDCHIPAGPLAAAASHTGAFWFQTFSRGVLRRSSRWKNGDRQRSFRSESFSRSPQDFDVRKFEACHHISSYVNGIPRDCHIPAGPLAAAASHTGAFWFQTFSRGVLRRSSRWKNGDRQRSFRSEGLSRSPQDFDVRKFEACHHISSYVNGIPRDCHIPAGPLAAAASHTGAFWFQTFSRGVLRRSSRWKNGDRQRSFRSEGLSRSPQDFDVRKFEACHHISSYVNGIPRDCHIPAGPLAAAASHTGAFWFQTFSRGVLRRSSRWKNGDRQRSFRSEGLSRSPQDFDVRKFEACHHISSYVNGIPRDCHIPAGPLAAAASHTGAFWFQTFSRGVLRRSSRWKNGDRQRSFRSEGLSRVPRRISTCGNSKPVTTFPAM